MKVNCQEAACPQACRGRVADAAVPSPPSRLDHCQPEARPHPSRRVSTSTHKRTGRRMASCTKLAPTAEPGPISPGSLPQVSSSSLASHRAVPPKDLEMEQGATRPDRSIRCHARSWPPGSTFGRITGNGVRRRMAVDSIPPTAVATSQSASRIFRAAPRSRSTREPCTALMPVLLTRMSTGPKTSPTRRTVSARCSGRRFDRPPRPRTRDRQAPRPPRADGR